MSSPMNRLLNISISGCNQACILTEFKGTEALAAPFSYELKLHTKGVLPNIVGSSATVTLAADSGTPRYFNGIIDECVSLKESDQQFSYYQLKLISWFGCLNKNKNNRVFINKTPKQIIQSVLQTYPLSQFTLSKLQGGTDPLEYYVQYQESDQHFLQRLFEQCGFFYYFVHTENTHQMVIADQISAYVDSNLSMVYTSMKPMQTNLVKWGHRYQLANSQIQQSDYNFTQPSNSLFEQASANTNPTNIGAYTIYPGNYSTSEAGLTLTQIRAKAAAIPANLVNTSSHHASLNPASTFKVTSHDIASEENSYVVISIEHHATDHGSVAAGHTSSPSTSSTKPPYVNHFLCMPARQVYYPPLETPYVSIAGTQTGVVTGPSGEEIYTDEYGRVEVQFRWVASDTKTPAASYWLRVAQLWAGNSWGSQFIPRIGHEVLISFENGDPSRPLVIGSAYNGDNMPPYALPENQNLSGIKTRSTMKGNSSQYNELHFDDSQGSEQVYIHAQKDLNQRINNNETIQVTNDYALTLQEGNQTIAVPQGSVTITAGKTLILNAGSSNIQMDWSGISIQGGVVKINT